MTKRPASPRTHSQCGHPLDKAVLAEVIPASCYYFANKRYKEGDMPDEVPEILYEYRCGVCLQKIDNGDLKYLQERLKGETDSG